MSLDTASKRIAGRLAEVYEANGEKFTVKYSPALLLTAMAGPVEIGRSTLNAWVRRGWVVQHERNENGKEYAFTDSGLETLEDL